MPYRSALPVLALAAAALVAAVPASAAQANFTAQLFGQAEVPPVATVAYGSCLGVLSEDETVFTLSCEHNLGDATGAHIHAGFSDDAGPIVFDLGDAASPVQATWSLDPEEAIRLLAGGLYVNLQTPGHPNGEIRGQLLATQPVAGRSLQLALSGGQEVPPVATSASGACSIGVDYEAFPFLPVLHVTLDIRCSHDVSGATGAELVLAPAGQTGTATMPLGDGSSPIETTVDLDSSIEINAFFNGNWYVNVLSAGHPDGELRGQLGGCVSTPQSLCLQDNRFEVTMTWNTETDTDKAVGRRETLDSGLFWFFRPSNIEALVKVLDGCGVNDHYWVFLAATTNVGYQLKVTDTLNDETRTYSNTRGNVAQPRLDTAAFATCP